MIKKFDIMNSKQKVLFISHDASRLGAPIVLLNLLQYIKEKSCFDFDVLLLGGGELEPEFRALSKVHIWNQVKKRTLSTKIFDKLTGYRYKEHHKTKYIKQFQVENYSLIYANTIVTAEMAVFLKTQLPTVKLLLHIHELESSIKLIIGHNLFKELVSQFDEVIAVSGAVKENLRTNYGVGVEKFNIIYPFSYQMVAPNEDVSLKVKTELDLKPGTFVVGASGYVDWRKGADIFIQLAKNFLTQYPGADVLFLWVGGITDSERIKVEYDLEKLSLTKAVKFIGARPNPADYFDLFDVFTMVSREDPFPLVCMECASLAKPILCFENAGGMPEFVSDDAGFVVPYMDVASMSDKINLLLHNETLKLSLGKNAQVKIKSKFLKEESIEKIVSLIKKVI